MANHKGKKLLKQLREDPEFKEKLRTLLAPTRGILFQETLRMHHWEEQYKHRFRTCPKCEGQEQECSRCSGTGKVRHKES
jgi:hypothetical protein